MKQENLDELKNIYLGLVTGGEGPEVLSEAGSYNVKAEEEAIKKRNAAFGFVGNQARRLANATVDSFKTDKNPTKGKDTFTASPKISAERSQSRFAGARDVAIEKAKQIKGSPVVGEKPAPAPAPAPVPPAQKPAPRPAAVPAKPMGGAPMDQFARANPTLAAKVKPGQSGYDTINTRLSADNDRGPSTPAPDNTSSSSSGSSSPEGETDRLKKALDIKKSDVNSSYEWSSVKTLKNIADAYSSVYEKKEYETSRDKDEDGDNDFADNMIARMVASGMSREEATKKVKNKDYNKKDELDEGIDNDGDTDKSDKYLLNRRKVRSKAIGEATAMSKRGLDEPAIRNQIASQTRGGEFADKATALADRNTYGDKKKKAGREELARKQRGDFRDTTSSSPGLRGYGHQSSDPAVKAKQDARGNQRARAALTPNERKQLNMEYDLYDLIQSHLLEYGFADTEEGANMIIENMSPSWIKQILSED